MSDIQVDPEMVKRGYAQRLNEEIERSMLLQAAASQLQTQLDEIRAENAGLRATDTQQKERIAELEEAATKPSEASARKR